MGYLRYKIRGLERRKLKKELNKVTIFVKNFWYYHNLDKDMCSFFGGEGNYPMSNKDAEKILNLNYEKMIRIKKLLSDIDCK